MSVVIENQIKIHRWVAWMICKLLAYQLDLKKYVISGSYRRGKWWSNDIDLLIPVQSESEILGIEANLLGLGWKLRPFRNTGREVFSRQFIRKFGDKYLILDIFLAPAGSWGNALLFTTGSKGFNDDIREHLINNGYSWINPRYFTHIKTNQKLSFDSEKSALRFLGIKWVSPKNRI